MSVSYDDPGFSGGVLERPALQQMLADIEAGWIDLVVVYKLDRLSRGMVHFARLMEMFERHHVTLVSVKQHLKSCDAAGHCWPFPRIINQKFRDGVPHATKAYAKAKSANYP